jgi:DNA polymerase III subunit delta'
MMLCGLPGIGKTIFAQQYAKFILCQQIAEAPCNSCRSCLLFQAGNHPDYIQLQPEEESRIIKVEQIRDLINRLSQTSGLGGYQVAVISKAEDLNHSAANALLKTLEEPQGQVLILLLSDRPTAVPATIRSRCQQIKLATPSKQDSKEWLAQHLTPGADVNIFLGIADYLPLKALYYSQANQLTLCSFLITSLQQIKADIIDPTKVATECLTEPKEILNLLLILVMDMIRIKFSAKGYLNHHDKLRELTQICDSLSLKRLFNFLDDIFEAIDALSRRNNVNLQLLMEKIFINWRYNNDVS